MTDQDETTTTRLRELVEAVTTTFPQSRIVILRKRARRRQVLRRSITTTAVVALAAGAVGAGISLSHPAAPDHRAALVVLPGSSPALVVDRSTDGLSGSLCDSPRVRPANYLDWPCATPQTGTAKKVLDAVYSELNAVYTAASAPRVRLLVDDPVSNHQVVEVWDDDHPDTGTSLQVFDQSGSSVSAVATGSGDLIASKAADAVLTKLPAIASVRLEPTGEVLAMHHGFATVPDKDHATLTSVVGLDAQGQSRPGWTAPWTVSSDDQLCGDGGAHGMCTGVPAEVAPVTDFCQSPSGNPPPRYLDWPCAAAADSTTAARVERARAALIAQHRSIQDPRVRLLADTRRSGSPSGESGPDVTLIELWDADGTGPAVLGGVIDDDHTPGALADWGGGVPAAGDPSIVLSGSYSGLSRLVFTRADVTSVELDAGDQHQVVHPDGGVANLVTSGLPFDSENAKTWTVSASASDGTAVGTGKWSEPYVDPCGGVTTSTCSVIGQEPVFASSPSP